MSAVFVEKFVPYTSDDGSQHGGYKTYLQDEKKKKYIESFGIKWASRKESLSLGVNNKGTDQPVHPGRLISAYVIRFLESFLT